MTTPVPTTTDMRRAVELFDGGHVRRHVIAAIARSLHPTGSGSFVVFRNHDFSSLQLGETIGMGWPADAELPPHAPDGTWGLGWRYRPILRVVRH